VFGDFLSVVLVIHASGFLGPRHAAVHRLLRDAQVLAFEDTGASQSNVKISVTSSSPRPPNPETSVAEKLPGFSFLLTCFKRASTLPLQIPISELPLPFKGRAGVGMGVFKSSIRRCLPMWQLTEPFFCLGMLDRRKPQRYTLLMRFNRRGLQNGG